MKRLLLFLAWLTLAHADDKPAQLFILSGQSNMAYMDPKLGFEPEALKLFPDAGVFYIKIAAGGQPIRYWVNEWNEIATRHGVDVAAARSSDKGQQMGAFFYPRILAQFEELLKAHPNPKSVTFCWMQGENDSRTSLHAPYADALKQLIANLRRDLRRPDMNVVIGRLCDYDKLNLASWEVIRHSQVEVARADPHGSWVDCDDLNNVVLKGEPANALHYTKTGYELLGRRFVRQARALIEGKPPAENGRPE